MGINSGNLVVRAAGINNLLFGNGQIKKAIFLHYNCNHFSISDQEWPQQEISTLSIFASTMALIYGNLARIYSKGRLLALPANNLTA